MSSPQPAEQILSTLEQQVDTLTALCSRLMASNAILTRDLLRLQERHAEVSRRNHAARTELQRHIRRLRAISNAS